MKKKFLIIIIFIFSFNSISSSGFEGCQIAAANNLIPFEDWSYLSKKDLAFSIGMGVDLNKIIKSISDSKKINNYNFKNLTCKYRIKLQRTSEKSKSNEDLFRNKISIVYKMNKKIKPFISSEMVHLQDINKYKYDEYRLSLGLNLNLSKKKSLKIFYLYKLEDLTKSDQDRINVFGLAYNLKR